MQGTTWSITERLAHACLGDALGWNTVVLRAPRMALRMPTHACARISRTMQANAPGQQDVQHAARNVCIDGDGASAILDAVHGGITAGRILSAVQQLVYSIHESSAVDMQQREAAALSVLVFDGLLRKGGASSATPVYEVSFVP